MVAILLGSNENSEETTREQSRPQGLYSHWQQLARFRYNNTHPIPDKRYRAHQLGFLFTGPDLNRKVGDPDVRS